MSDNQAEAATEANEQAVQYFIQVRDQKVEIGVPDGTQLAVMRMTAGRLGRMNPETVSGEEAVRAMEKVIRIVTSLPKDREDREWIENMLLDGEMGLVEASNLMEAATKEWSKTGNRATKRAARSRKATAAKS